MIIDIALMDDIINSIDTIYVLWYNKRLEIVNTIVLRFEKKKMDLFPIIAFHEIVKKIK
jgi:hypothetical protein